MGSSTLWSSRTRMARTWGSSSSMASSNGCRRIHRSAKSSCRSSTSAHQHRNSTSSSSKCSSSSSREWSKSSKLAAGSLQEATTFYRETSSKKILSRRWASKDWYRGCPTTTSTSTTCSRSNDSSTSSSSTTFSPSSASCRTSSTTDNKASSTTTSSTGPSRQADPLKGISKRCRWEASCCTSSTSSSWSRECGNSRSQRSSSFHGADFLRSTSSTTSITMCCSSSTTSKSTECSACSRDSNGRSGWLLCAEEVDPVCQIACWHQLGLPTPWAAWTLSSLVGQIPRGHVRNFEPIRMKVPKIVEKQFKDIFPGEEQSTMTVVGKNHSRHYLQLHEAAARISMPSNGSMSSNSRWWLSSGLKIGKMQRSSNTWCRSSKWISRTTFQNGSSSSTSPRPLMSSLSNGDPTTIWIGQPVLGFMAETDFEDLAIVGFKDFNPMWSFPTWAGIWSTSPLAWMHLISKKVQATKRML